MLPSMGRSYHKNIGGTTNKLDIPPAAGTIAKTFEVSAEGEVEMDVTESIVSDEDLLDMEADRVNYK